MGHAYIAAFVLLFSDLFSFLQSILGKESYYESLCSNVLWILINGAIAFVCKEQDFY
jgi:hypothetical protein